MKKIIYTFLFISAFLISSCSDENEDTNPQQPTEENQNPNQGEEIPEEISEEVSEEVEIEGDMNTGTFPSATGQLTFENESEKIDIIPENSITIAFQTDNIPDGVYAQIVTAEGTPIDDVFFNITTIGTADFSDTFFTFDVSVGDQISTGTFFIKYAIYQGDNVADSEIVCITVNQSISRPDIVGRWELVINDVPELITINCNNGTTFETVDFINISDSVIIEFNDDGTYETENLFTSRDLDFTASAQECTAVFFLEESFDEILKGTWSFDNSTNELFIINTEVDDLIDDANDEIIPESERSTDINIAGIRNNGNTLILTINTEEGTFSSTYNKL